MSEIDRTLENFLDEEDELSSDADLSAPASRSGWIFLLDCTPTMIGLDKHGSTNPTGFQLALRCCQTVQQNKAIASPKDMVGLVFMRTKKSSSSDLKNIYIVQPLDTVNAPRILELDAMLKLSPTELMSHYGALDKEPFDFHHALWTCQNMFSNSTKSMGYRHIFLFTDDPDPVNGRLHAKRQALAKVSDLYQSGIVFEVLPIKVEGVTFDFALFYQDLLSNSSSDCADSQLSRPDPAERIEQLLTRVRSRELPERRLTSLLFHLGPDSRMSLGVSVYCLLRRTPLPSGVRLSAHDNRPITARRNWYKVTKPGGGFDPQTDLLQSHDIMRGIKMGSRYLCFESDELNRAMKELAPVGLYLLGFKPLKELKRHYHIRPPQFVYPNESLVRGSRTWFSLLLHVCLRRDLFALAVYVQRKRTAPRLVALTPQAERLDADGTQLYPPGFLLVFLPYADDFRNLDLPSVSLASEDQVEAAKSLIKKLTVPFDPRQIHNPLLQRHYAMLEALALNKDELPTEVIDETCFPLLPSKAFVPIQGEFLQYVINVALTDCRKVPNIAGINRRAGAELENFKRACHLEDASSVKWPRREFEPGASGQSTPELTTEHIRGLVERDELHTLTVPTLRQALKILNSTPMGRKKLDLVNQITDHFR